MGFSVAPIAERLEVLEPIIAVRPAVAKMVRVHLVSIGEIHLAEFALPARTFEKLLFAASPIVAEQHFGAIRPDKRITASIAAIDFRLRILEADHCAARYCRVSMFLNRSTPFQVPMYMKRPAYSAERGFERTPLAIASSKACRECLKTG